VIACFGAQSVLQRCLQCRHRLKPRQRLKAARGSLGRAGIGGAHRTTTCCFWGRQPRVRDRGQPGEMLIRFSPAILPPYARRTKSRGVDTDPSSQGHFDRRLRGSVDGARRHGCRRPFGLDNRTPTLHGLTTSMPQPSGGCLATALSRRRKPGRPPVKGRTKCT
jgi:hypothetical protein